MANFFFLLFAATIIITRLVLFLFPMPSPTIGTFRTHHYMYGLVILAVGVLVHSVVAYAIGMGLFVDELAYLLIGGKTHQDNYSKISLLGTLALVAIVFLLRDDLVFLFRNT